MANVKTRAIQACEMLLAVRKTPEKVALSWDKNKFEAIIANIFGRALPDKAKRKVDSWVMVLEDLQDDEKYWWGSFTSTRYGTKPDLIHAESLKTRENPRDIKEGDKQDTHFLVRKSDGLTLIELGFQDVVTRSKISEYIDECGKDEMAVQGVEYSQLSPLLSRDFFEEMSRLENIKSTLIQVSTSAASGMNNAFKTMYQDASETEAHTFSFGLKAKQRFYLPYDNVERYVRKYIDMGGITAVQVTGLIDKVEKTVNLDTNMEKYRPKVDFDDNGRVKSASMYATLKEIADERSAIPKVVREDEKRSRKTVADD